MCYIKRNMFKRLTGGAPELNAEFRYLAAKGKELGKDVIVRSNLTCLSEPGKNLLITKTNR